MVLVKILKRKDASSVVAGVAVALLSVQFVATLTQDLANKISSWQWHNSGSAYGGPPNSFQVMYLQPLVAFVLQLVALEILAWIFVLASSSMKGKK